jgi:probable rRNA maturation factor
LSIEVINESDFSAIDESEFVALAKHVFTQMRVDLLADLTIVFNTPEEMARLHKQWMGLDGPTDVMSFPIDELTPGILGNRVDATSLRGETPVLDLCLGDIAICPEVASKQAIGTGHTAHEEMLLLAVHGILHLLGYDHAKADERKQMFDLQRQLLLGYIANRDTLELSEVTIKGLPS